MTRTFTEANKGNEGGTAFRPVDLRFTIYADRGVTPLFQPGDEPGGETKNTKARYRIGNPSRVGGRQGLSLLRPGFCFSGCAPEEEKKHGDSPQYHDRSMRRLRSGTPGPEKVQALLFGRLPRRNLAQTASTSDSQTVHRVWNPARWQTQRCPILFRSVPNEAVGETSPSEGRMTPLQGARNHCANYQPDGSCLGIGIKEDGSLSRFQPAGTKCLLAQPGVRCQYFEECVMPMEKSAWKSPLEQNQFAEAVRDYRLRSGALSLARRICPVCQARELEPRHQLC